ncbi:MAG: hypothetical protein ACRYG7_14765 [Janthinobacterium lividum]
MVLSLLLELRLLLISISQVVFLGWVAFSSLLVGGFWMLMRVAAGIDNSAKPVAQPRWQTSILLAFLGVCTYFIVDFFF